MEFGVSFWIASELTTTGIPREFYIAWWALCREPTLNRDNGANDAPAKRRLSPCVPLAHQVATYGAGGVKSVVAKCVNSKSRGHFVDKGGLTPGLKSIILTDFAQRRSGSAAQARPGQDTITALRDSRETPRKLNARWDQGI
jgi:hypothetical protein